MGIDAQPVLLPRTKRHYRTADERRHIVEETFVSGTSVAVIARAHGVNANQVFAWRKLFEAGRLGTTTSASFGRASASCVRLLPVTVADDPEDELPVPVLASTPCADREAVVVSGFIDLTLAKARVRITGHVDAGVLRVVLECLRG